MDVNKRPSRTRHIESTQKLYDLHLIIFEYASSLNCLWDSSFRLVIENSCLDLFSSSRLFVIMNFMEDREQPE